MTPISALGPDDIVDLVVSAVRSATADELRTSIERLGEKADHPRARVELRRATDVWIDVWCGDWDRWVPTWAGELSTEERQFIDVLERSDACFSRVAELVIAALEGDPPTVLTRRHPTARRLAWLDERLGKRMTEIERGSASESTASYLVALASFSGRKLPNDIELRVAHRAAAAAGQGPLSRLASDFSALCRSRHSPDADDAPIRAVIEAVERTLTREWSTVVASYAGLALAQLPHEDERTRLLGLLRDLAVRTARRHGHEEAEAITTVWSEAVPLLWVTPGLMSAYLDDWTRLGSPVPHDHVARLRRVKSSAAMPHGVEIVLQRRDATEQATIRLFSAAVSQARPSLLLSRMSATAGSDQWSTFAKDAAILIATAHQARDLTPSVRQPDGELWPAAPVLPNHYLRSVLGSLLSTGSGRDTVLLLATADAASLLTAAEILAADGRHSTRELLLRTAISHAPTLTSRLLAAHALSTSETGRVAELVRLSKTGDANIDWPALASVVLGEVEDEASFALSFLGDPLTTACVEFVSRRIAVVRTSDEQSIVHAYVQALVAAPTIDPKVVELVLTTVAQCRSVTPDDVDNRVLLAAKLARTRGEREAVIRAIEDLGSRRVYAARRTTGLAIDNTGECSRQFMAALALLGPKSVLDKDERAFVVATVRRAVHPPATAMVAITLGSQPVLSQTEAMWLGALARPPSYLREFIALGATNGMARLRRLPPADSDPAAGRVVVAAAAYSIGELLRRSKTGEATLPRDAPAYYVRRLQTLAAKAEQLRAQERAYSSSPTTIPRILSSPLYLNDTHRDAFDYVRMARRALVRSGERISGP